MGEQAANIVVEGEVDLLSVNGGNLGDRLEPGTVFRVQGNADTAYALTVDTVREPLLRCGAAPIIELGRRTPFEIGQDTSDDFNPGCFGGAGADGVFNVEWQSQGACG